MSLEFRHDDWWVFEGQASHKLKDYPFWGYEVQNHWIIKLTCSKSLTRTNCTHTTSNQPQEIKRLLKGEVIDKQHKGKTNSRTPKFAYLKTASSLMQHNSIQEFQLSEKVMQHRRREVASTVDGGEHKFSNPKLKICRPSCNIIVCDNSLSPRTSCSTTGEKW